MCSIHGAVCTAISALLSGHSLNNCDATKDFIFFPYSFSSFTPLLLFLLLSLPSPCSSSSSVARIIIRQALHKSSIESRNRTNQVRNLDRRNQKSRLSRLNRAVSGTLHCSLLYQQTSLLFVLNCSALAFASN